MPTDPPPTDPCIDAIVQAVAELPDRTSPDDWPEAMLITADELRVILTDRLAAERQQATAQQEELRAELKQLESVKAQLITRGEQDWSALFEIEGGVPAPFRIAAFLRRYAFQLRDHGHWDIPQTMAAALESGAAAIDAYGKHAEAEVVRLTAENERLRGALDTQLRITTEHWQVIETQRQELARLQRPWRSRVEHAEGVAFLVADAVDPRDAEIARLTAVQTSLEAEVASLTKQVETATKAHRWLTSEPIDKLQRIETRCPSCGNTTLFVGSGGHLTCSWLKCNEPGVERAVEQFLANVVAKDAEVASLTQQLAEQQEVERLKQAAIMSASLANTPEGVAQRLPKDHPYWSPGYQDVCEVVDREMNLRQQLAEARQEMSAAHEALNEAGAPDKETVPDFTRGEDHYVARRLGLAQRIHRLNQHR